jgi:hypothetical protein
MADDYVKTDQWPMRPYFNLTGLIVIKIKHRFASLLPELPIQAKAADTN